MYKRQLRAGIEISYSDDGERIRYTTAPAKVLRISDYSIEITIFEGKKRQIRRMMEKLGNRVLDLHRSSIGKLELDEFSLDPGQYIEVTREDIIGSI